MNVYRKLFVLLFNFKNYLQSQVKRVYNIIYL